jgi:hypothetical protein
MPDATLAPSFSKLVQSFFAEHLVQQRALSPAPSPPTGTPFGYC